jgi:hypothetical protein
MALWLVLVNQVGLLGAVILVLSFTPGNSLVRPILLPLIAALVFYALLLNKEAITHKATWTLLNMNTAGLLLQYLDFGLISRWTYSAYGPTSSLGGQRNANLNLADRKKLQRQSSNLLSRLQWGLSTATTWRAPATPWEVKGTPHFKQLPSRGHFIAENTMRLIWSLLILDMMSLVGGQPNPEANAAKFSWDKVRILTRLGEVSRDEVILRIVVVYVRWMAIYYFIQAFYCFLAIIFVSTGILEVISWPPMFGSITQMYTVRHTWG